MEMFSATAEQLANALSALGVRFILSKENAGPTWVAQPKRLIAELAESREARLRLALIPLFLEHPEYAIHARAAASELGHTGQVTLWCYYTAAVLLQRMHGEKWKVRVGDTESLPDLFSEPLGLQFTADIEQDLGALANRHQSLSGLKLNWLGAYQHAFRVWKRGMLIKTN